MNLNQLRTYNFISIHTYCCTESIKIARKVPLLFPDHHVERINSPCRKINFKQKVRMGMVESKIHDIIYNAEQNIKRHKQYCINIVPLFSIFWIQQYRPVSPYLIKEAIELFKKIDLIIIPTRCDFIDRHGEASWFVESKIIKKIEFDTSINITNLMFDNNIEYISLNKMLNIAQGEV